MPTQIALPAGALPPAPAGWLVIMPLACLLLGQILLVTSGSLPVLDGSLGDPDSYMRLNRVVNLHHGGAWFDASEPRINPPAGHTQHWTRPLDLLLWGGALLLQPALGFARALHVVGVIFSPICLGLAVLALAWASAPLLDRDGRLLACLALLLQPSVLAYGSLGRPDHHSLLLLLFILMLGATLRLLLQPQDRRMAAAAGLVAGLAIWISTEALVFVGASLAVLGLGWLGGRPLAQGHLLLLAVLTAVLLAGLAIERGPAWHSGEVDRLSLAHVAAFAMIGLFWLVVSAGEGSQQARQDRARRIAGEHLPPFAGRPRLLSGGGRLAGRTALAAAGVVALAWSMSALFPELRAGPLGAVDPLYDRLRLQRILEIQPLVPWRLLAAGDYAAAAARLLQFTGIAFLAIPFLLLVLVRREGPQRPAWWALTVLLAVFLPLAWHQVRWSSYAEVLLVPVYVALVVHLVRRLAAGADPRWLPAWRPLVIVACLVWPILGVAALPHAKVATVRAACPLQELIAALPAGDGTPKTILALADYGPEILYRSRHAVLSIPNHRPQPGFVAGYRALAATDDAEARALLAGQRVDWVLLCGSPSERDAFAPPGEAQPGMLYDRLVDGKPPAWLRPLPLPPELAPARLYRYAG